ncbi:hypothetical protein WJX73_008265 [Symbiochloris irregularis]|uniref:Protein kinase domain-containing protein n=1 Tax=Symbiochloris irregularis TaxID=706552 RepID=A0AAW1P7H6_9CHLO
MPAGGGRPVVEGTQVSIPLPATGPFPSPVSHLFPVQTKRAWAPFGQNPTHKVSGRDAPYGPSDPLQEHESALTMATRACALDPSAAYLAAPRSAHGPRYRNASMRTISPDYEGKVAGAIHQSSLTSSAGPVAGDLKEPDGGWVRDDFLLDVNDCGSYLGGGEFAQVYSATEKHSGHTVALKVIDASVLNERGLVKVARELEVHSKLCADGASFNILRLFGQFFDETEGKQYLVLEKGSGDLFELLYTDEEDVYCPQPEDVTAKIVSSIVHGLACVLKTCCGTQAYMAPEVYVGRADKQAPEGYDERADWWAVGIMLYECLYAEHPFYEPKRGALNTREDIAAGVLHFPLSPEVSDAAKLLIRKLMVQDPAARLSPAQILQDPWFVDDHPEAIRPGIPSNPPAANTVPGDTASVVGSGESSGRSSVESYDLYGGAEPQDTTSGALAEQVCPSA